MGWLDKRKEEITTTVEEGLPVGLRDYFPDNITQIIVDGKVKNPIKQYEMYVAIPHNYKTLRVHENNFPIDAREIKSLIKPEYSLAAFREKDIRELIKSDFLGVTYKTMKTSFVGGFENSKDDLYEIRFLVTPKKIRFETPKNIDELPLPVVFVNPKTADIIYSNTDYRIITENGKPEISTYCV